MSDVNELPSLLGSLVDQVCRDAAGVRGDVRDVVASLVDRLAPLAPETLRADAVAAAVARLTGLDELEHHLLDPDVDEVMVNCGREVWVDRDGDLVRVGELADGAIDVVIERVLAPTGRRLDRTTPIVDVRLPDGARVCAAVEPIAVGGSALAIRRHRQGVLPIGAFTTSRDVADLLDEIVAARCNLVVSGATSSGKTTLVAALLARLPGSERLVVCEDTAELPLGDRHVVRLESRPATADGVATIDLSALVRTALRLRPDRLVVGEFRGGEVLAAVEAMNTGHDGSIATCHANGATDALRRVETLLMQAAPTWPLVAIRRQVSRSIDIVIHLERAAGDRRVAEVLEVAEADGEPTGRPLVSGGRLIGELQRRRRGPRRTGTRSR